MLIRHLVTALAALLLHPAQAAPVTLDLDTGPVVASGTDRLLTLKGLPYAAPPVGEGRWRPPQPVAAWRQPRPATAFGASCPQRRELRFVAPGTAAAATSEDCLFINAWAPRHVAQAAPVVVWIHGGGNVADTASQTFYDGTAFARDGIVFVSFNYRLGLLGFFAHPALAEKSGARYANFGLMDQIAALQWVQRNIRVLGGDPRNVTVMGESAGAVDILCLMSTPAARGLFARAIVESAPLGWRDRLTLEQAQADGAHVATELGLDGAHASAAALRGVTVEALLGAQGQREIQPILDRTLLGASALEVFAAGQAAPLPLLIGTNDGEGSLLGPAAVPGFLFPALSEAELAKLRNAYGPAAADAHAFARLLLRDRYFAAPARWIASRQARVAPTFLYRFDYVASIFRDIRTSASHGSEIPFVFQTGRFTRASADDIRVSTVMHDCWVSFIKTGVPACTTDPWPRYTAAGDQMMRFTEHPESVKTPDAGILDLLAEPSGT